MGVDVVVGGATDDELLAVERLFHRWERAFSRFRNDSELSRVNASPARTVVVSELFARVVRTALSAARATGGLVDPTLGAAIEAAGYDRDFAALEDDPRPPGAARLGSWRTVGSAGRLLSRAPDTALDLNGVVKALAVDEAVRLLDGPGFVSAGGDLAARGAVTVALPDGAAVQLVAGGIATSGTTHRRWSRGGAVQHHLLDPRTGRPSTSPWTQVTVAAGSCLAADVAAKAAFLLGDDGPEWLEARGLPGRFLAGRVEVANATWRGATAALDRRAGARP
jgi:FAD:protein FMN transferase